MAPVRRTGVHATSAEPPYECRRSGWEPRRYLRAEDALERLYSSGVSGPSVCHGADKNITFRLFMDFGRVAVDKDIFDIPR